MADEPLLGTLQNVQDGKNVTAGVLSWLSLEEAQITGGHLITDGSNPFNGLVTKATETVNRDPYQAFAGRNVMPFV